MIAEVEIALRKKTARQLVYLLTFERKSYSREALGVAKRLLEQKQLPQEAIKNIRKSISEERRQSRQVKGSNWTHVIGFEFLAGVFESILLLIRV